MLSEAVRYLMLKCCPSVYPGCACLLLIPIMHQTDSTQIKCTFRCRFSTGGWVIQDETQHLLTRALKLMHPFGFGMGDLKKSETLREQHNHCLTTDQSQYSPPHSSDSRTDKYRELLCLKFYYVLYGQVGSVLGGSVVRCWTLCWILSYAKLNQVR